MKIDEAAKKIIDETKRVRAKVDDNNSLIIASLNRPYEDWFLMFPAKATSWNQILEVWNSLDHVTAQDLARVTDVLQRLLDTPVEERFPEKKYRLVAKRKFDEMPKYVKEITTGFDETIFYYTALKSEAMQYDDEFLEGLTEREPSLAPIIDAMKKEVKDDE